MTITRCFVAEGDTARAIIDAIRSHNDHVSSEADKIKDELGAESVWFGQEDGFLKGFKFPGGTPRKGFKEVRNGVKYPVQTTKEGKALAARLNKLRRKTATSAVTDIEEFGAHWGHVSDGYISFPVGVMLPYKDDPKMLAKISMSDDKKYAVPAGWREIKEWELLKFVDDWNNRAPLQQIDEGEQ